MAIGIIFIIFGIISYFSPEIFEQPSNIADASKLVGIILITLGVGVITGFEMAKSETEK